MSLAIGDPAPKFTLPGADGGEHGFDPPVARPATATVIAFTCNHCPYALAWEDRLLAVGADYADRGVRMLAINPNDATRYPDDSFEQMKRRVAERPWPIPYLRDEEQSVAAAYGAETTPHVFVFEAGARLAYAGAPDADYEEPALNAAWLRAALDAVLNGTAPDPAQTRAVGCSVKWKA